MRFFLLLALGAALLLAAFNPDPEDFQTFVRAHAEAAVSRRAGDSALGRMLSGAAAAAAGSAAAGLAERRNYGVCSVYRVDLGPSGADPQDWAFLGIAGQFVELQRPASLQDEN